MQTKLAIRYTGVAVDAGSMDVYEAAANMIAFSQFVVSAAKQVYGEETDAKAEVVGFTKGSFTTELVFKVAGATATLFASNSAKDVIDLINSSFDLWKHLRGAPPTKVETADGSQQVSITNNNGQVINVNANTVNLVFSEKNAEAVQTFVCKALDKPGMDSVEITSQEKKLQSVSQEQRSYFGPVAPTRDVTDNTIRVSLIIEAAVFRDGNKWRFSDGQLGFFADVIDDSFLARVNNGERFGKGDVLDVDLRLTQQQQGMKLVTNRTVVKVYDHRPGPEQRLMFGQ